VNKSWFPYLFISLLGILALLVAGSSLQVRAGIREAARESLTGQAEDYARQLRHCAGGGALLTVESLESCARQLLADEHRSVGGLILSRGDKEVLFSIVGEGGAEKGGIHVTVPMHGRMPDASLRFTFRSGAMSPWERLGRTNMVLSLLIAAVLILVSIALTRATLRNLRLQNELWQSKSLSQMGLMAAHMAHEIRNPLAGIRGLTQVLAERIKDPGDSEHLAVIVSETQRLERLTTDLLRFARPRDPVPSPAKVKEAILQVLREADPEGRILFDAHEEGAVYADGEQVHQLFLNLIKNAVEHSPSGVQVRLSENRQRVVVEISNPLHAPPTEDPEKYFEPFYSAKAGGTGLGLAISRQLVQRNGGRITVRRVPPDRICFSVEFPRG
jgi:signal transduction histidine kinase